MNMLEKAMQAREQRGKSPEFLAAIDKEKKEFQAILKNLGTKTFEAGTTTLLKSPTDIFLNGLKVISNDKYTGKNYARDIKNLFIGKNGVAHSIGKVVAGAVHLAGQSTKIGIRQLFKL